MCLSLLSWERGLKLNDMTPDERNLLVAPLVGAWIEIQAGENYMSALSESLLSWERGLK